jgi:ferredoxin
MRVEVDRSRCEGHGMCEEAAPEIFQLDEDGELRILQPQVPPELERKALAAVRLCPVAALRALDGDNAASGGQA